MAALLGSVLLCPQLTLSLCHISIMKTQACVSVIPCTTDIVVAQGMIGLCDVTFIWKCLGY